MIQRVQTLWLALATLLSVGVFILPLAIFDFNFKQMPVTIVYNVLPGESSGLQTSVALTTLITNILTGLISLVVIFLYKNRPLQRKLLAFAFLFAVIELACTYFYQLDAGMAEIIGNICKGTPEVIDATIRVAKTTWGFGAFLPLVQLVCFVFALKGIRKDEALVRSADRLR